MIVVDTSVVLCLWVPSAFTALAERALRQDAVWAAPFLWRSQFREFLGRCLRRRAMSLEAALKAIEGSELLLKGQEYNVPSEKILKLAVESGRSACDCEFVALAEDLNVPLVTTDDAVVKRFPRVACGLKSFAEPGKRRSSI